MKTYLALVLGCSVMFGCGGGAGSAIPGSGGRGIFTQQASISIPAAGGIVTLPQVGEAGASMQFAPSTAALEATATTATGLIAAAPQSTLWPGCLMPDQSEMLVFLVAAAQISGVPAVTITGAVADGTAWNGAPAAWYGMELFDANAPSGAGPIYVARATSVGGLVSFAAGSSPWDVMPNHQYIFAIVSSESVPCSSGVAN